MARVGQQRHRRKKLLEKVFMNNVVYGTAQASVHFLEFTLEQRGDHPFSPPTNNQIVSCFNTNLCLKQ